MKGVHNPDRLIDVAADPPELNEALEQVVIIDDLPPASHGNEILRQRHPCHGSPMLQKLFFPLRETQVELNFLPFFCQKRSLLSGVVWRSDLNNVQVEHQGQKSQKASYKNRGFFIRQAWNLWPQIRLQGGIPLDPFQRKAAAVPLSFRFLLEPKGTIAGAQKSWCSN